MNKKVIGIILTIILLSSFIVTVQSKKFNQNELFIKSDLNWHWAINAGSIENDYGYGITVDSNGYIYQIGTFMDTATFGSISLTSAGDTDVFISKLDENGNFLWAKQAGGSDYDEGYDICIDNNGDILLTGNFKNTANFGSFSLTSTGDKDIFIVKIDTNGNFIWAKQAGGSISDLSYSITTDISGDIYITGLFTNSANFGSISLTSYGGNDIFIAKLDTNGNFIWATNAGSTAHDYGYSITVDANGFSYITGYFWYTAQFGQFSITSAGRADIFVAKLDANGDFLWAKQAGGTLTDGGNDIAVDDEGNIYITGKFFEQAQFGSINLTGLGFQEVFIAKTDANGDWLWAKHASGDSIDVGTSLKLDADGNIYVYGYFSTNTTFGTTTLTSNGIADVFIATLSSSGNWLDVNQAGGINDDCGYDLCIDNNQNIYIIGTFQHETNFGNLNLTSYGEYDVFIVKSSFVNQPPQYPYITGPVEGEAGIEYDYTFFTIDPENEDVYYYIDWDDGNVEYWIGPYSSGQEVIISHSWDKEGTYTVKAKAKDTYGLESTWGQLIVTMPVIYQTINHFLSWFFEFFPNAFPIIQYILGLL